MRRIEGLALLLLVGCATAPELPHDYARDALDTAWSGRGAWTIVRLSDSQERQGELLAVEPQRIVLLRIEDSSLLRIERSAIREVRIVHSDAMVGNVLGWGVLGMLSTLSHGYYLVFSAPMWIVATAINTHSAANAAESTYSADLSQLHLWARFPQGLPEHFVP